MHYFSRLGRGPPEESVRGLPIVHTEMHTQKQQQQTDLNFFDISFIFLLLRRCNIVDHAISNSSILEQFLVSLEIAKVYCTMPQLVYRLLPLSSLVQPQEIARNHDATDTNRILPRNGLVTVRDLIGRPFTTRKNFVHFNPSFYFFFFVFNFGVCPKG